MLHPTGIEAYKPSEIATQVKAAGVSKARLPFVQMFTLSVLAGVFIGLGALAYTAVMTDVDTGYGPSRFLGGIVFSLGLILVIIGGAELFTGNALMVMAAVDRLITPSELIRSWVIVYVGNFLGAVALVILVSSSGLLGGAVAETARAFATGKLALGWDEAIARGILCNLLVCLAVWLSLAAKSVAGKVLVIAWPIAVFVMLGFEHSVANMYLIPQAMLAGEQISIGGFAHNLFFVTAGNIIGGAGGVALAYRLAYGRRAG